MFRSSKPGNTRKDKHRATFLVYLLIMSGSAHPFAYALVNGAK